jgi:hypothetical protein
MEPWLQIMCCAFISFFKHLGNRITHEREIFWNLESEKWLK